MVVNPAAIPPDVRHQTTNIEPDLIQDVTQSKEQPDLTKSGNRNQPEELHYRGEPEKVYLHICRTSHIEFFSIIWQLAIWLKCRTLTFPIHNIEVFLSYI